jgi:dTDP-3-amino-3,4,6-trideoxy-alpha-D-glucose transaminase
VRPVPFLDLRREIAEIGDELGDAFDEVVRGGRFVGGDPVTAFEEAFAAYCGAAHAVGVASGTDAITLALLASGVSVGDEVITAANTTIPTIVGIERAGGVPVLADVDEATATLDPVSVAAVVTSRTRAIVPVHLYGQCAPMDALASIAAANELLIVEDAAQAHGAEYRGRRTGTLGTAAAFSFFPTKNLGALGDGGAVVTDDPVIAERVRLLRNYGESERYLSVMHGMNSRLDTIQAALLLVKLRRLEAWTERRRRLAIGYLDALAAVNVDLPSVAKECRHVWHLFVVGADDRDEVRRALAAEGVETLLHYPRPVHHHPAYSDLGSGDLSRSERHCARAISLPLNPYLTDNEARRVVEVLRQTVGTSDRPDRAQT